MKKVQGFGQINHEVLLLKKFLQTKPKVKGMKINYYDLNYTVIENRDDNEIVVDKYENKCFNFNNFTTPNHSLGRKNNIELLK